MAKYSVEELNQFSKEQLISMFISNQEQLEKMNDNLEKLIEQIRIADQNRFGRRTERLDEIAGQMSLFNEAEAYADDSAPEPEGDEVIISVRRKKKAGKRAEDFKDLPHEPHPHKLTNEQLDAYFGKGCWRRLKPEEFIRVRCQPACDAFTGGGDSECQVHERAAAVQDREPVQDQRRQYLPSDHGKLGDPRL